MCSGCNYIERKLSWGSATTGLNVHRRVVGFMISSREALFSKQGLIQKILDGVRCRLTCPRCKWVFTFLGRELSPVLSVDKRLWLRSPPVLRGGCSTQTKMALQLFCFSNVQVRASFAALDRTRHIALFLALAGPTSDSECCQAWRKQDYDACYRCLVFFQKHRSDQKMSPYFVFSVYVLNGKTNERMIHGLRCWCCIVIPSFLGLFCSFLNFESFFS